MQTNKKPNRASNSEWACSTFGKDTCSINSKDVHLNDIFYVGVRCGSTYDGFCTFSIQPSLKVEVQLEDGIEQQIDFKDYEAKVFKFYIPSKTRDESTRIRSVVITAAPLLPTDEKMNLYASTKGAINPKQQDLPKKGTSGWRKGQTLRLSEEDDSNDWCTDCFITILLDVTQAGMYQVIAKSNMGIVQLQDGQKIDDVAFYGEKQCYTYFVKEVATDISIRLAQFSGIVSYAFNYGTIPKSFEEADFKQADFGNSELRLTPIDRGVTRATGLYYLCVFAHMTSTYSLVIMETPMDQSFHYLEDSWDQSGEVQGTNIAVFLYKVPPLDFKGEDISVEFLLTSISGETPKMFAAFCKDSITNLTNCGEGIIKEYVTGGSAYGFLQAKAVGKGLSLQIDHDETQCLNVYNGECYYTVVLVG